MVSYSGPDFNDIDIHRKLGKSGLTTDGTPRHPPEESDRKEFKRLLDDDRNNDDQEQAKKDGDKKSKIKKDSVFDVAAGGSLPQSRKAKEEKALNPLALMAQESASDASLLDSQKSAVMPVMTPENAQQAPLGMSQVDSPLPKPDLQAITEQMASAMMSLKASDRTEITVILKHPPSLAGAELMVVEHKTAPGQFNVKFSNLNPDGRSLLDNPHSHDSLRLAMQMKGYAVHMIETRSEGETPMIAEDPRAQKERGEEDAGDQQQKRRQQQEESPED